MVEYTLLQGDAQQMLASLADHSVQCVVTSPRITVCDAMA